MTSAAPPRLATWMLRHLMAGDHDEALAGDLLESFRAGKTANWYRRQTLMACLVSWSLALQARLPLVFFAIAWSMLAPEWHLLCDRVSDSRIVTDLPKIIQNTFGPLWLIPVLIGWTVLHASFVWVGALVYSAAQGTLGTPLRHERVRRGLLLAAIVLDVLYPLAILFGAVWGSSIPGLSSQRLAPTAIGRITDIRLLPDLMRIPYFIALVSALWGAVVTSPRFRNKPMFADDVAQQPPSAARFVVLLVVAGSMNAILFGFLLCRLPTFHASSVTPLLIQATASVGFGVLGGVAGTWLYWKSPWSLFRDRTPFSPGLFVLVCASAWAWAPACAFFSEQLSAATAIAAAIGSYLLFAGLRGAAPLLLPNLDIAQSVPAREQSLFADPLASPRFEFDGYLIAVTLYAGCAAILYGANHTAAMLLALCTGVFAWKRQDPVNDSSDERSRTFRRFAVRLVAASLAAVLATAWALLDEASHHSQIVSASAYDGADDKNHRADAGRGRATANSNYRGIGYESLILYPVPEKQTIVPPIPSRISLLAAGTTTPVTMRFTGSYQYVQPPNKHPGPHAHRAYGTPLHADIESSNSIPVIMDAHQEFAVPIQTDRCSTIQVDVANFDNVMGPISLAVLLGDDSAGRTRTLYLGQQPIVSTQVGDFSLKSRPIFESLSFSVPMRATLRKFDEITVVVLSDTEHSFVAPKIAIEAFRLFPR
jgi:hypothetical protein